MGFVRRPARELRYPLPMRSTALAFVLALPFVPACGGDGGGSDGGRTFSDVPSATECAGGPLAAPIPGCMPTALPSTGDPAEDCVRRINQFRWECQCLPPLARWTDGEACADQDAEYDSTRTPHAS